MIKVSIKEKIAFNDRVTPLKIYKDITIARTGSQDYAESEIKQDGDPLKLVKIHRLKDEVKKSASLMNNLPIVENHPQDFVDFDKSNTKVIGVVTNPRFKDNGVVADLIFYHKPKYNEFSVGYDANLSLIDGNYHQSNIKPNHLANLDKSRCGIICSLTNKKRVNDMKIIFNDTEHEVSDTVGAYITVLQKNVLDAKKATEKAFNDGVTAQADKEKVTAVAKARKITFSDTDTVKDIKFAIVKDMGIDTDGKSMDFVDGIISVSESIGNSNKESVTKADDFSFTDLVMGGK